MMTRVVEIEDGNCKMCPFSELTPLVEGKKYYIYECTKRCLFEECPLPTRAEYIIQGLKDNFIGIYMKPVKEALGDDNDNS